MTKKPFIAKNGILANGPATNALGTVTGNATLDLSTGNVFTHTPTANTTFVFNNPPASGTGYSFDLKVTGAAVANILYNSNTYDSSYGPPFGPPSDASFNGDGTKIYYGDTGNTIFQHSLSTAYDITTNTYDGVSYSIPAFHFAFNSNGTKLYGGNASSITQYSLSTAYDLSTATSDGPAKTFTESNYPVDFSFSPDGTKAYLMSLSGYPDPVLYQYSASTPYDINSLTYDNVSYLFPSVSNSEGNAGFAFNSDGTKLVFGSGDDLRLFSLSSPYDISTLTLVDSGTNGLPISSVKFNGDYSQIVGVSFYGTTIYATDYQEFTPTITYPASVSWLDASAPADPADGEVLSLTFSTTDGGTTYYGAKVGASASGAALTAVSTSGANQTVNFDTTDIHVSTIDAESVTYTFSGANQVEALTLSLKNNILIPDSVPGTFPSYTADFTSQLTSVNGVGFKGDGTKAYLRGYTGTTHTIAQYSLSTAWDLRTATFDGLLSVALSTTTSENGVPLFKSDGTKMYTATNGYYQYSLTTPWDITSGVTADGLVHSASGADFSGDVKSDGTKFYSSVGSSGTLVAETILTTPWDFSTATTTEYSIMSAYTDLRGMSVIADGSKILLRGNRASFGYGIMLIDLTTPYDVSTRLTWDTAENYLGTVPNSQGISTDSTDTYMYLGGAGVVEVYTINGIPSLAFPTSIVNSSSISTPDYQGEVNIDLFTYDGGTSYHIK